MNDSGAKAERRDTKGSPGEKRDEEEWGRINVELHMNFGAKESPGRNK